VDEFIAYWQIKRDKSRHGIVEVILLIALSLFSFLRLRR